MPPLESEGTRFSSRFTELRASRFHGEDAFRSFTKGSNKGHIEIIRVEVLDVVVVERLFCHIKQITDLPEYTEALEAKRQEKARALAQVLDSLKSISLEQERLVVQISKAESEGVRDLFSKQVENLEREKERLQKILPTLQKEHDALLSSLDTELMLLEHNWQDYDIDRRVALLNFLIYSVEVDLVSPRFIRVRVTWLREDWGCEQMYLCRHTLGCRRWTAEEERLIREHYPTSPRKVLLEAIPYRTWAQMRERANQLGLKRILLERDGDLPQELDLTLLDLQFMQKEGIPMSTKRTNWTNLSILMSIG